MASTSSIPTSPYIGIDFGARYTRVAVVNSTTRKVEIIPNDRGDFATPTSVAWDVVTGKAVIGDDAKHQSVLNPTNTVFDFKRLLGQPLDSTEVQLAITQLPYKIMNRENKPVIQVTIKGERREFTPEEITAMILVKMKKLAEHFLGEPIQDAVVAVPAYFNDVQRQAMIDAGTKAGLSLRCPLSDPVLAAIAHRIDKTAKEERQVLVINFSGDTMDVTVLTIDTGIFEILAMNNELIYVDGDDVDKRIMDYCISQWKTHEHIDISTDVEALQMLRLEVERVKLVLGSESIAMITIKSTVSTKVLKASIEQSQIELWTRETAEPLFGIVEEIMRRGGLKMNDVDDIVLTGESKRLPVVRRLMTELFEGKELLTGIPEDEATVHGAAVVAGLYRDQVDDSKRELLITPIVVYSLGVETAGGLMERIVHRSTPTPTRKQMTFRPLQANQTEIAIRIFEGERSLTNYNRFLGQITLSGWPSPSTDTTMIEIEFEIDAEFEILMVTAREVRTGLSESLRIYLNESSLAYVEDPRDETARQREVRQDIQEEEATIRSRIEQWLNNDRDGNADIECELFKTVNAIIPVIMPTHDEL